MAPFDPNRFGPAVAELLTPRRLAPLGPGKPELARRPQLARLTVESLIPGEAYLNRPYVEACRAGLWLYHDFLDQAHEVSQELDDAAGAYWHAIVHRREPDPSNSKYWLRRVGKHAIFPALWAESLALAEEHSQRNVARLLEVSGEWDPFAFVDLCAEVQRGDPSQQALCEAIQLREWELLFGDCYTRATGRGG